jgi:pimeloyl-ACP methyl ester carboxylesterase
MNIVALLILLSAQPSLAERSSRLTLTDGGVDAEGAEIYFRRGGSGPALLLLHGFGVTGDFWEPFLDDLGEEFTLIIPDLRGHGRSTNETGTFTYRESARDMFTLLDRVGIHRIKGVGHSAGATTLLHMAIQRPDRIEAMVLAGGGHRMLMGGRQRLRDYPDLEALPPAIQRYLRDVHPGGDSQIRSLIAQYRALGDNYDDYEFSPERLATVHSRTLLIWGDEDSVEVAFEMYQSIPGARLWVVPGQGHFPLWPDWGGSKEAARTFPSVVRDIFRQQ